MEEQDTIQAYKYLFVPVMHDIGTTILQTQLDLTNNSIRDNSFKNLLYHRGSTDDSLLPGFVKKENKYIVYVNLRGNLFVIHNN